MTEWEAKYRALVLAINDKAVVDNAAALVQVAVDISYSNRHLSLGEIMHTLLTAASVFVDQKQLDKLGIEIKEFE